MLWLLEEPTSEYHAIADFRKDNPGSIKKIHREFVILCKSPNLFGGELIAIDSVYLEGNASRASVMTANKLKHLIKQIDDEILKYHKELDRNDTIVPVPTIIQSVKRSNS